MNENIDDIGVVVDASVETGKERFDKLSSKKQKKLLQLKENYLIKENLIIARRARKTIRYIEKNISNFPNDYMVLKSRIINTLYDILEHIYKANVFDSIDHKKEIIVCIRMLNFYLYESFDKKLISRKKYESYTNHLLEIDLMVRSWFNYEKSE